jgi:ankyrin repeat protein
MCPRNFPEGADRFSYRGHNLILDIMNSEDKLTPADAKVLGIPYPPYQAQDFFSDPEVAELAQAARQGDVKRVDALIAKGVKVNATGAEGLTPLMYALSGKSLKGFERLLQRGADPNVQTTFGESAVSYAAARNGSEALKMVLAHRGNPNFRGRLGPPYTNPFTEPPIYDAITFRRPENARILIKAGADVNARNWLGRTPLMYAAVIYSYDVAYVLLEAGADFRATDPLGYTFIHYLAPNGFSDPKR